MEEARYLWSVILVLILMTLWVLLAAGFVATLAFVAGQPAPLAEEDDSETEAA